MQHAPAAGCGRKNPLAIATACGINARMNAYDRRYYFWYYGFPMPQAEEGTRSS
jgi:hypothetical protein